MTKQTKLFSVLIANYNNGRFIGKTLESIRIQTYKNLEIIIVDDASRDNSLEKIRKYQLMDSRIRLHLNKENLGCGFTKKRCVEMSKGKYCGFVDPEDTISEHAIELMVEEHEKNPDASLVFSNYYRCDNKLNIVKLCKPRISDGLLKKPHLLQTSISHFCTFKKSYYLKTDGINPQVKRAVDHDLYLKLEEAGSVYYLNKNLYFYRYHEYGISAYENRYKALFWFDFVKREACERRNIDKVEFFSEDYKKLMNYYREKIDYRVGRIILLPVRFILSYMRRIYHKFNR